MYFVVAVAALEIAALFAAALREIARGDADGILVRSGQFLGLAGIGECGFAVTHAVIRRGIQAERRDRPRTMARCIERSEPAIYVPREWKPTRTS